MMMLSMPSGASSFMCTVMPMHTDSLREPWQESDVQGQGLAAEYPFNILQLHQLFLAAPWTCKTRNNPGQEGAGVGVHFPDSRKDEVGGQR